jgi:large subunit ribosomal protein L31e
MANKSEKRAAVAEVITRETTVHLHKFVHGRQFKKRAPSAIKAIKMAAEKMMGTKDVRVDPKLNKAIWSHGIKNVPRRIRVRLSRKRNDDEEAKQKLYTVVSFVPVASFSGMASVFNSYLCLGLQTEAIDE